MGENEEIDLYGANIPLLDKLRLLSEWAPLLGRLQLVAVAETPYDKAVAVISAVQWAAGKSTTDIDDEALAHLQAVLKTPEGKAFYEWAVKKAGIA